MCRNIKKLHNFFPPATDRETRTATLQYVHKVSGATKPVVANEGPFEQEVLEVAAATSRLLDSLTTYAPPRDCEVAAARA